MTTWLNLRDGIEAAVTANVDGTTKVVSTERTVETWPEFLDLLASTVDGELMLRAVIITHGQPFRVKLAEDEAAGGYRWHAYTFRVLQLQGVKDTEASEHDAAITRAMTVLDALEAALDWETGGGGNIYNGEEVGSVTVEVTRAEFNAYGPVGSWMVDAKVTLAVRTQVAIT